MDAEQTWPTEEELAEATAKKKITKIVPKGTSEYQAAWIPDEDGGMYYLRPFLIWFSFLLLPIGRIYDSCDFVKNCFSFSESLRESEGSEDEDVSMDEAKSEADSSKDLEEDDEEYETMTVSEAGVDGERYDQEINMLEENQAMEKFKGKYGYV